MKTTDPTPLKKLARKKLSESAAILAKNLAARASTPLIVSGVGRGKLVVLQPSELSRLNVDESYQRVRLTAEVNSLIHAMSAGGLIPDPISVAERPNGDLFIVDGQQRFWAHVELARPLAAMVYPVDNLESEKQLFLAMNRSVKISNDFIVHAWPGETGAYIRQLNEKLTGPYGSKINFGKDHRRPYQASTLARSMAALTCSARAWRGRIDEVLSRTDKALPTRGQRDRVEAFFMVFHRVFPPTEHCRVLPAIALGRIAQERWLTHIVTPTPGTVTKLAGTKWITHAPTLADRFLPLLEDVIRRRWKP